MAKDARRRGDDDRSALSDDFSDFLDLLNELKSTGCNLLVVGDAPRRLFTRASAHLFGDTEEIRYRVLGVTDVTPQSVAERLPEPTTTPRPLSETTHVVNLAASFRSMTAATDPDTPSKLAGVRETAVESQQITGLRSDLTDAITHFDDRRESPREVDLRVGLDSLEPLMVRNGEDAVRECVREVGRYVRDANAMGHYVLPKPYDCDLVQSLVPDVDAVVELRAVDPAEYGHDAQERWHVPSQDLTMDWTPL